MRLKTKKEKRADRRRNMFSREQYADDVMDLISTFRQWVVDSYKALPELEKKFKDLPGTNYRLGVQYLKESRYSDALMRFKVALWLQPRYTAAWFRLGRCYQALGNKPKAAEHYRKALALKPDYPEAAFMLAIVEGKGVPAPRPPLSLVVEQFERLAPYFRGYYVDSVGYNGHVAAEKAVTDWVGITLSGDKSPVLARFDMLELGCGQGMTGERLRLYARSFVGVDICKAMIDLIPAPVPGQRAIYDRIFHEEIGAYLARHPHNMMDIIVAAGVFNSIGDLRTIIEPAAHVLRPGGVLAFSVERLQDEKSTSYSWDFDRGSYAHSLAYIRDLCAAAGLKEFRVDDIMLYRGVFGYQCLFVKG
jgi:predicted TPR repeat methyltransferase